MSVLYLLVPLALVLVAGFVAAYVWSSRNGQFDDLETPALRVLIDDQPIAKSRNRSDDGSPSSG